MSNALIIYRVSVRNLFYYFQCIGPYCQPGTEGTLTQTLEIVSSVGFVDVSQRAVSVTAEKPQFTAKLPGDFFYPFS